MSAVHDKIAIKSLEVQKEKIKKVFSPFIKEFKKSSWYPDLFADKSMDRKAKMEIDKDADKFIYPDPPDVSWHKKLENIADKKYIRKPILFGKSILSAIMSGMPLILLKTEIYSRQLNFAEFIRMLLRIFANLYTL